MKSENKSEESERTRKSRKSGAVDSVKKARKRGPKVQESEKVEPERERTEH